MPSNFALRFLSFSLLAAPLLAQTQIGGGTCSSSSLSGAYAVSLTGREVASAGTFTSVLQGNGTATFDGLSVVNIKLSNNTNQGVATPLAWSGTYSVESNCVATVNITSGGSATLSLAIYSSGVTNPVEDFQLTGSDATYSYSGGGIEVAQSTTCSTATLDGVYAFNGTGFVLTSGAVSGATDVAGLLQFDGQGNLTVNTTTATSGTTSNAVSLTGSYAVSSNCVGSATLTDSSSNSYAMSFSIYNVTAANTGFYVTLEGSSLLLAGGGHAVYGQPSGTSTPQAGQPITGGTCSTSNLTGAYNLVLSGRAISAAGNLTGSFESIGTAAFDGQGDVTLTGTDNTNLAQAQPFSYTGTYSVASNCSGTLTINTTSAATFALVVWNQGANFDIEGSDANYVYSGSGTNTAPPACATSTLSGEYTYTATGFTLSGTTQTGSEDEAGVLQFDGQGGVKATYTLDQGGATPVTGSTSGTYAVTSRCLATATLVSSAGVATALNAVVSGVYGQTLDLLLGGSQFLRAGSAHSAFANPSANIGNVASYIYSATPAGSIFVVFGQDFATQTKGAATLPLPDQLLNTLVTVNGEAAPLFYVSSNQIDAQMPWDIQGNTVASVVVTNGTSVSNAAAVYVPAAATPGISYVNNRAPVVNADGSVNSASAPAAVGDEVVVYFTGGGPVQGSGALTTGAAAPPGESPVTGTNSITVGGVAAKVVYMGLTPGSVGLYQANFIVPSIAKGAYPVVITIAGNSSNNPVMNVSN